MDQRILEELVRITGKDHVLTREADRWCYAYDATDLLHLPEAVVFPGSTAEIAAILRLAHEHCFPVIPRGAGTGRAGGAVPLKGGVVLVLTRLNRILEISPEDLVAVVEPGVITGVLKKAVEAYGLFYPPDPSSADYCTIGGNVATGAGGALAVQYGVTRDYVLGLEVVLPTGEIIETGARTMKRVVGYDLTRLFLGSEGTLGVITRIVLRLVPKPPSRLSVVAGFATLEEALAALGQVVRRRLLPAAVEFMDQATLACIREMLPFSLPEGVRALLLFMVDGQPRDVRHRVAVLAKTLKAEGAAFLLRSRDEAEAEKLWAARRAISPATFKIRPHKVSEDVAVPLGRIAAFVTQVQEIARRQHLPIICFGHAGDGNIHVNIMFDQEDPRERQAAHAALGELFALVRNLRGTISGEHGIGVAKAPYIGLELSEAALNLQRRLKKVFDPHNIMNPGKIFPGPGSPDLCGG